MKGIDCNHDPRDMDVLADQALESLNSDGALPPGDVAGLEYLGQGNDRIAYVLPCNHVLKITHGAPEQTLFEFHTWRDASGELRDLLAPVHDADALYGRWLVMEYVELIAYMDVNGRSHQDLEARLEEWGIGDQHGGNVGWLDERLVSLDYGMPVRRRAVREWRD